MATTFLYLPPGGGASDYLANPVADPSALPATANVGKLIFVLSDNSLRYFDGAAWQILTAGPAGTYVLKAGDTMSGDLTISTLTASRALTTNGSKKLVSSSTTDTELGFVNGVTSAIQTQLNGKQATITGAATTITALDLAVSRALASDASGKVAVATTTATELGYVSGVSSAIQTQLNAKQATITGAATTIVSSDLSVSRAVVSDASGKVAAATTTATEIGFVNGVTSAIQTQIDTKITGPGSATANALTRYSGTTGKLAKDSAVTLDDSGNMVFTGTTSSLRLANLTTTQRDALTAANGMIIYNTTTLKVEVRENGSWNQITGWGS